MTEANDARPAGNGPRRAPKPQERRRDSERTKAQILDAATEVFSEKGYDGARVAEIAKRAGVNAQLIAYYFDGKEGLYREIGRRWREHEERAYPEDMDLAESVRRRVLDTAGGDFGPKMLAWQGLTDTGEDDADARGRNERLRQEVEALRQRQEAGELDPELDPAALMLILMSAGDALSVYPHLARGLFNAEDPRSPEMIRRYADQLAQLVDKLRPASKGD
ncbi:MAG: TetR/AcrR family transcriptional regulator [Stackebrandtia sp.]